MKVCPHCGEIVTYNSYFGAYICNKCGWEPDTEERRDGTARVFGTTTVPIGGATAASILKVTQAKRRRTAAGTGLQRPRV